MYTAFACPDDIGMLIFDLNDQKVSIIRCENVHKQMLNLLSCVNVLLQLLELYL